MSKKGEELVKTMTTRDNVKGKTNNTKKKRGPKDILKIFNKVRKTI